MLRESYQESNGRAVSAASGNIGTQFSDEAVRLAEINAGLEDAWNRVNRSIDRMDRAYMDAKRYMVQNCGELDLHEMFQNELALKQLDHTGAFAVSERDKLAGLMDSPCFAHIDLRTEESGEPQRYYIGRFSFSHEDEPLIIDWRAPIAGMFCDCEVGPAWYDAPIGRIQQNAIEPMRGHGEVPRVTACRDRSDEILKIQSQIDAFRRNGHVSLGIITKTDRDARELYSLLSKERDIHLITSASTRFADGVSVASVRMSKGLEFDEVIVPDVDDDAYKTEYDGRRLYVACTRAMHWLTLFHTGKRSRLIEQQNESHA